MTAVLGVALLITGFAVILRTVMRSLNRLHRARTINYPIFLAVIATIVGIEYLTPSTWISGLSRPAPSTSTHLLDVIADTPDSITYGDVAQTAPWLWTFGTITRAEMEHRLLADIDLVRNTKIENDNEQPETASSWDSFEARQLAVDLAIDGLEATLADLDALFVTDTVDIHMADVFVADHFQTVAKVHHDEIFAAMTTLTEAVDARKAELVAADVPATQHHTDEKFSTLSDEASAKRRLWYTISLYSTRIGSSVFSQDFAPKPLTSADRFPQFPGLITTYTTDYVLNTDAHEAKHTGPEADTSFFRTWRLLRAAFEGRQRSAQSQSSEWRCGLFFVQPGDNVEVKFGCDVSQIISADYDITGAGCATDPTRTPETLTEWGTQGAADICKESWIFPTLNMAFTTDSLTITAPTPAGWTTADGPAPLSAWFVQWNGRRYPLDQSPRLDFDPRSDLPADFAIVQDVRPTISQPRIWQNFATDRTGTDNDTAIRGDASAAHDFTPIIHDSAIARLHLAGITNILQVLEAGGLPNQITAFAETRSTLRQLIAEHRREIRQDASDLSSLPDIEIDHCPFSSVVLRQYVNLSLKTELKDLASTVPGPACETYYALFAIMQLMERSYQPGTWLWLIPEP